MNIYNLIILDESGSMSAIRHQAISSINETIQTIKSAQKKYPDQKQFISIISFSGTGMEGVKLIRDKVHAQDVTEVSEEDYQPNGCTPLYDAIGFGTTSLDKTIGKGDTVLATIITDGMDNTSQVYSARAISELVASQRRKGWIFVYIGANQDAIEAARVMNISNALNFTADIQGTEEMFRRMNLGCKKLYHKLNECQCSAYDYSNFFDEADNDLSEGKAED